MSAYFFLEKNFTTFFQSSTLESGDLFSRRLRAILIFPRRFSNFSYLNSIKINFRWGVIQGRSPLVTPLVNSEDWRRIVVL